MMRISISVLFLMFSLNSLAQYIISGDVYDADGLSLSGSTIILSEQVFMTDSKGEFRSLPIPTGKHPLQVSFIGFKTLDTIIDVKSNQMLHLHLAEDATLLEQVVVNADREKKTYNSKRIRQAELTKNYSGSFAKTLERVQGVNAIEIGAGGSKPIIRGLGFNRVAVAENGIKQEGQQWGADHALEIDALNTEDVEVIKGVGTIEYGSDAIGGVISINNENAPQPHTFVGSATLFGKTVNETYGLSANIKSRGDAFFYKLKVTGLEYGDYDIPTDRIYYLYTNIPIVNRRLKNTAGKELDLYAQFGYINRGIKTVFSLSNVYNKSGFFPGSHGIPSVRSVRDDGDRRNIDLPNQYVNHFKANNSTSVSLSEVDELEFKVAFQNNKRRESSYFHSHYGMQKAPENNPDLELEFDLNTFDLEAKHIHLSRNNHKTVFGYQQNFQNNNIGGYGFLLPKFHRTSFGLFGIREHQFSDRLKTEIGGRFDYAEIVVRPFFDNILYNYLKGKNEVEEVALEYAQRSRKLNRSFRSFNLMLGANYGLADSWDLGATIGTNFRFPTAIELAANGLHHGAFRHEKGDTELNPEKGVAFDMRVDFNREDFKSSLSPYVYYFTNYIFLKPSGEFSILPDSGQIYQYTQSKAVLSGLDWKIEKTFWKKIKTEAVFEFIYNRQITGEARRNYPLPFTTPMNLYAQIDYAFKDLKHLKNSHVNINVKWYGEQKRIAQGEEITPAYKMFGVGLSTELNTRNFVAKIFLTGTNLFNTKAFNHTSYYRAIQIPELGRSFQMMVQFSF